MLEKYTFDDFTLNNLYELLFKIKNNYKFVDYFNTKNENSFVIMRHDVDMSLEYALKIAEIESSLDIKATYFLWLQSQFYNAFEESNKDIIKNIIDLGHNIGIHFDHSYYNVKNEKELTKYLSYDKYIFNKILNIDVKIFSFHNPNEFTLKWKKNKYADLINTYSDIFYNEIAYCSDSNGYWIYERLEDVINKKKYNKLQILLHPEWWQEEVLSPRNRVLNIINRRSDKIIKEYDIKLAEIGRKNVR